MFFVVLLGVTTFQRGVLRQGGRARHIPSETVFHNVCSEAHRALLVLSRLEKLERDMA